MNPDPMREFGESITVDPGLIHLGEPITIHLTSRLEYLPLTLEVTAQYLEHEFTVGEGMRIVWRDEGEEKRGTVTFEPEQPGNYRVRFGDLFRSFAVIDESYAVCTFWTPIASSRHARGNQLDLYHPDFHPNSLPVDYDVMITDERSVDPDWDVNKNLRAFHALYGDAVIPFLDGMGLYVLDSRFAGRSDPNLHSLSDDDAVAALQALRERWDALGFGAPEVIDMYTPGNAIVRAARRSGVLGIGGLYPDQDVTDDATGQTIRQFDLPERPYYMAKEDFRKPARKTDDAVIGFPAHSGHTLLARSGYPVALDPDVYRLRGWASPDDMSRFYALIDDLIANAGQSAPFVFSVAIEGDEFDTVEMNRLTIKYLSEKPRTSRLVFAHKADVARYWLRRFAATPETTAYLTDTLAGLPHTQESGLGRPHDIGERFPDALVIENESLKAGFLRPDPKPAFLYDYTTPWTVPATERGPLVDLTGVTIHATVHDERGHVIYRYEVESAQSYERFPIAVWDVPRVDTRARGVVKTFGRWVPARSDREGMSNGAVICRVSPGKQRMEVRVRK